MPRSGAGWPCRYPRSPSAVEVSSCGENDDHEPQVIYVVRNPKDVSVSLYNHAKAKQPEQFVGDVSDMIRSFVQGR